MSSTTLFDELLADRLATDPGSPLLTHYDAVEDSRIELSAVTSANWAAKIAGLLRDGHGLLPGDHVVLDMAPHWISAVTMLGCWWAGVQMAAPGPEGTNADTPPALTVCTIDRIDAYDDADPLLVAGLDSFAMAPLELPVGVDALASEARVYPDAYLPDAGTPQPLAWATVDGVIAADARQQPLRLITAEEPDTRTLAEYLLRVCAHGGALVLATGAAQRWPSNPGGPTGAESMDSPDTTAARQAWLDHIRAAEKIDGEAAPR